MYNITTLNKISPVGLKHFTNDYSISDNLESTMGILVRSQDLHEITFPKSLVAIARAGAGTNNIPAEQCADRGIVVFNTPGANANAVKELVLAGLFLSARNIPSAINWAATLTDNVGRTVEKGKSQFAGTEIQGKTLGVVGLGAIGLLVVESAKALGMNIAGYDPYLNVEGNHDALSNIKIFSALEDMLPQCDYVTIHVPVMDSTKGMFNAAMFEKMKNDAVLLNFSRDKLVNDLDLIDALNSKHISAYVTDFPNETVLNKEGVIALPHLGASTTEAEDNCATMAVKEIMDFIENGNITNSVNFPNTSLGSRTEDNRICIFTKNEPNPVKLAAAMFSNLTINAIVGGTKDKYGYALISTPDMVESVPKLDEVIAIRVLQDM